jgi:hypothetical protein
MNFNINFKINIYIILFFIILFYFDFFTTTGSVQSITLSTIVKEGSIKI